jgi:hypothetical protein
LNAEDRNIGIKNLLKESFFLKKGMQENAMFSQSVDVLKTQIERQEYRFYLLQQLRNDMNLSNGLWILLFCNYHLHL